MIEFILYNISPIQINYAREYYHKVGGAIPPRAFANSGTN